MLKTVKIVWAWPQAQWRYFVEILPYLSLLLWTPRQTVNEWCKIRLTTFLCTSGSFPSDTMSHGFFEPAHSRSFVNCIRNVSPLLWRGPSWIVEILLHRFCSFKTAVRVDWILHLSQLLFSKIVPRRISYIVQCMNYNWGWPPGTPTISTRVSEDDSIG